jgi:bifunctional DNA-binding transcriptional regulator/antitoxin component of YhaV-PrlF toxin-antitoxin module
MGKGFSEAPQARYGQSEAGSGSAADFEVGTRARFKIGPGGRVVIPAAMREALGVVEGDVLVGSLVGNQLRLVTMRSALDEARALVQQSVPAGRSLARELIAERRREAEREDRD